MFWKFTNAPLRWLPLTFWIRWLIACLSASPQSRWMAAANSPPNSNWLASNETCRCSCSRPVPPKLNGHVERSHRTHHEEFYQVIPEHWNVAQLNPQLRRWEHIYNTVRPHQALRYLTPLEFLKHCKTQKKKAECH